MQCSVLPVCLCNTQCVLSALTRRQSNAGTPRTNWGQRMPNICHSQLLPALSINLEGCQSRYDSFVHCIKTRQHFWPADLSLQGNADKVTRWGVDGEFAKILGRQKSSWAFSGPRIISHILPISYPASAFPGRWWKIWESSNCQMVQMADNLSSQVNLGRLSISECLSTCILRVTLVDRVMVGSQWLELVEWEKVAISTTLKIPRHNFQEPSTFQGPSGSLHWSSGHGTGRRKVVTDEIWELWHQCPAPQWAVSLKV